MQATSHDRAGEADAVTPAPPVTASQEAQASKLYPLGGSTLRNSFGFGSSVLVHDDQKLLQLQLSSRSSEVQRDAVTIGLLSGASDEFEQLLGYG
jgi:hypothetical protein